MEKIQLIYNPYAGARKFAYLLDYTIEAFQKKGSMVHVYRSTSPDDIRSLILRNSCHDYTAILIAGGDGSVNLAVNTLLKANLDIPLGIIPAGTANDFAGHLGIPRDLRKAVISLSNMEIRQVDVGLVNSQYFINVCSGGLLTDISQKIDLDRKNTLGKIAYYLKGMQELPHFKSMKLRIISREVDIEEDFYLYLVLNGSSAGGFTKLGGPASVDDGKLDFVGFKAMNLAQLPVVFSKMLLGEHINDRRVLYFQTEALRIESSETEDINMETDVDGEKGPVYPLNISVLPGRLKILSPTY